MANPEICIKCCWCTYTGGKIFCPFIEGTCLRRNQVFLNAVLNDGRNEPNTSTDGAVRNKEKGN